MSEIPFPIKTFKVDELRVEIYDNRAFMGRAAALRAVELMKSIIEGKGRLNIVFASAPSQQEFLSELSRAEGVWWQKTTAFHLDEYIGLSEDSPQNFGNFLRQRIFNKVQPGAVHYINGSADNPNNECRRYSELLKQNPLDMAFIGIGENGHIAFNDPEFADFNDSKMMKVVRPDLTSRMQQVHDGCFKALEEVPTSAFTMTIPAILSADVVFCIVPAKTKARAVKNTLEGPITTKCPACILRRHENAVLFLDRDSAGMLS